MDGRSIVPLLEGDAGWPGRPVISEFFAEGSLAPCFMVREGRYKYIYCASDPPQLYDLELDPQERNNLSSNQEFREVEHRLKEIVMHHHDPVELRRAVLESQKRRMFVFQATMQGKKTSWDYSPACDASSQYMRNHLDLNNVEKKARIESGE